jgi:hypothetical protein
MRWMTELRCGKILFSLLKGCGASKYYSAFWNSDLANWRLVEWENLGGNVISGSSPLSFWNAIPNVNPKARPTGTATAFPIWRYLQKSSEAGHINTMLVTAVTARPRIHRHKRLRTGQCIHFIGGRKQQFHHSKNQLWKQNSLAKTSRAVQTSIGPLF